MCFQPHYWLERVHSSEREEGWSVRARDDVVPEELAERGRQLDERIEETRPGHQDWDYSLEPCGKGPPRLGCVALGERQKCALAGFVRELQETEVLQRQPCVPPVPQAASIQELIYDTGLYPGCPEEALSVARRIFQQDEETFFRAGFVTRQRYVRDIAARWRNGGVPYQAVGAFQIACRELT